MKLIALVSGGKDSVLAMLECVRMKHDIVCMANLYPIKKVSDAVDSYVNPTSLEINDEIDSYCFQTVGTHAVENIAACFQGGVPLRRAGIYEGQSIQTELQYKAVHAPETPTVYSQDGGKDGACSPTPRSNSTNKDITPEVDEVEVLYRLLKSIKEEFPDVNGVCSGAILSTYQRLRVENVCERLGLISIAPLWQLTGTEVLRLVTKHEVNAILIKVSTMGLDPRKYLGKSLLLPSIQEHLVSLEEKFHVHPAGEGGEFETLVLDCPLFTSQKLVIDSDCEVIMVDDNPLAPTGRLAFRSSLANKGEAPSGDHSQMSALSNTDTDDSAPLVKPFHSCYPCGLSPEQLTKAAKEEFGMDADRLVGSFGAGDITNAVEASTVLTTSRVECTDEEAVENHILGLFTTNDSLRDVHDSNCSSFSSVVTTLVSFSSDTCLSEEEQLKKLVGAAVKATILPVGCSSDSYKRLLFVLIYSPTSISRFSSLNRAYLDGMRDYDSIAKHSIADSPSSPVSNIARAFICVSGLKVVTLSLVFGVSQKSEKQVCSMPITVPSIDSLRVQSISAWAAACIGPYPHAVAFPLVSVPAERAMGDPSSLGSLLASDDDVEEQPIIINSIFISGRIGMDPITLDMIKPKLNEAHPASSLEFRIFASEFFYMIGNVITVIPVMIRGKGGNPWGATVEEAKERIFGGWSNNTTKDEREPLDSVGGCISIFVTNKKHVVWARALFMFVLRCSLLYSSTEKFRTPQIMLFSQLPKNALVEMISFLPAPTLCGTIRVNGRAMDPSRFCVI